MLKGLEARVAKKNKKSKKLKRATSDKVEIDPVTGEDRRAEATTVAWMLTMLATTAADALALAAWLIFPLLFDMTEEDAHMAVLVFPRLLLLIAALTGAACVALTPMVYRFRRVAPPPAITVFGLVASIAPVVILFWLSVSH
jgi:hypothetical protein